MKAQLEQELKDLIEAFQMGYISNIEYQDQYYTISQKIKKLS